MYARIARPLISLLPAETSHRLVLGALARPTVWGWAARRGSASDPRLETQLCGIPLKNPIGLAAGFDKDCRALSGLAKLGFGYLVGGTVFPVRRAGNPKPRLVRVPEQQALINAMGFPSRGVNFAELALRRADTGGTPVMVSIAALAVEDFVELHRRTEPLAAGVEINISSPNTAGLAVFQEPDNLARVLGAIMPRRTKPLFVKLPSGFDDASRERVLRLARVCAAAGVDGVVAGNTRPVQEPRLAMGKGGLSGRPLLADTLRTVAETRDAVGSSLAVTACGGIFTGEDVHRALLAGATTVQVYTAFIYRGPGVVKAMARELLHEMAGVAPSGSR